MQEGPMGPDSIEVLQVSQIHIPVMTNDGREQVFAQNGLLGSAPEVSTVPAGRRYPSIRYSKAPERWHIHSRWTRTSPKERA